MIHWTLDWCSGEWRMITELDKSLTSQQRYYKEYLTAGFEAGKGDGSA